MVTLKMMEAIVDQLAVKCAERARTGARSGEVYTPYAVESFDTERSLSNGCVHYFAVGLQSLCSLLSCHAIS